MTEKWYEILIDVPVAAADLLCYHLNDLGSVGVVVEERDLDTFIPPDPDETDGDSFTVKAYFAAGVNMPMLRLQIMDCLRGMSYEFPQLDKVDIRVGEIGQQDWAEDWKQHFSTTHIGSRLIIKPSWEEYTPKADDVVVTLDPGMAFGTGTHGTTHLCLQMLAQLFVAEAGCAAPRRVLDVGTGSGILAIAAAALGAQEVVACDIDPQACVTARENIIQNGCEEVISVTDSLLEELGYDFDVILANILAEENIRLAVPLLERLSDGGTLILSGILDEKVAMVMDAFDSYPQFNLQKAQIHYEQEWACIIYSKLG